MKQQSRTQSAPRAARPRLEALEGREVPALIGALDPSFGTAGKATTDFTGNDRANAVAVQADGKIVVVGQGTPPGVDFAVARYNPDGTLDTTFDTDGKQTIAFGNVDVATGVAIQADGKIVVVGYTNNPGNNDFAVARLNPDGSLDTAGFGGGTGKLTVPFDLGGTNDDRATGVAIQTDGKIVVGGWSERAAAGDFDFSVARLKTDGTLDTGSFTATGKAVVAFDLGPVGSREDKANAVAIQADGKIVLAGFAQVTATERDFAVARLKTDGTLDNAGGFDTDGRQTIDFGDDDRANAVAVRPDGRIVLAGSWDGGASDFAVAQLTTDGKLDPTFGGGFFAAGSGKFNLTFGTGTFGQAEFATGVALQGDGKIVVAGRTDNNVAAGPDNFGVARVLADGSGLDTTFNGTGKAQVDFGGDDEGAAVALDNNGRIVVAGATATGDFAVARLIGFVDRPVALSVGGSLDGRGTAFNPDAMAKYGTPVVSPANLFPGFTGNVRTAIGDVNGDGVEDGILVTGPGTAIRFAVVSGVDGTTVLVPPTAPFVGSETFPGGGFVTAADLDNDGRAEVIFTPDQGGGPRVTIWSLVGTTAAVKANFFGIADADFRGGARIGAGDINADGVADLAVAAGFQGGPRIELIDGKTVTTTQTRLVAPFFAFPDVLRNGVFVAVGDINGDGFGDLLVGAGPGGGPVLKILSGKVLMTSGSVAAQTDANKLGEFFVGGSDSDRSGVRVAAVDADGDNKADVAVGTGGGVAARVRVYLGKNFTGTSEPGAFQDLSVFGGTALLDGVFVG